ncbi:hypothetical protein RRG08_026791 [Elysia crispata]|uniref:Uncharacterized protein n=1 Tax=Elysia crispata TaxID=231223 RepID=A0AAE1AQ60_9GAST|nr:hypothetical protein RRG08_026791 [Elysia crispata]
MKVNIPIAATNSTRSQSSEGRSWANSLHKSRELFLMATTQQQLRFPGSHFTVLFRSAINMIIQSNFFLTPTGGCTVDIIYDQVDRCPRLTMLFPQKWTSRRRAVRRPSAADLYPLFLSPDLPSLGRKSTDLLIAETRLPSLI